MLSEKENQIIGMIYDAVLDPQIWNQALQEIVEFTNSNTAIFTVLDQLSPNYDFTFTHNIPEEGLIAYQDRNIQIIDMRLHARLWETIGVGEAYYLDCRDYKDQSLDSDKYIFYEKCLKSADIGYIGAVLLETGKYRWAVLGLHRQTQEKNYNPEEMNILKRLGVHIRRALQIHRQIVAVKQENTNLYAILEHIELGVILLDKLGHLFYTNSQAKSHLENSSLIMLNSDNKLKVGHKLQHKLDQLIFSSYLDNHYHTVDCATRGGTLALSENGKHLMLSIVPLSQLSKYGINHNHEVVAIFLTEPKRSYSLAEDFLVQIYHLTKRELDICRLFVNQYSLKEIASHCGITMSSLRTYLKHIFSKTETKSQVELMHLLLGMRVNFEHIES